MTSTRRRFSSSNNWLLNSYEIVGNDGITIESFGRRSSVLTIDPAQANHAGNYTCQAKNYAGSTNHTTELLVYG